MTDDSFIYLLRAFSRKNYYYSCFLPDVILYAYPLSWCMLWAWRMGRILLYYYFGNSVSEDIFYWYISGKNDSLVGVIEN